MTASEIFEELGYKRNVEDNKITYSQKFGYETFEIMFDLSEKEINIDTDMEVKIEEDILQAIDKQAEELGWLDEKQEIKQETNLERYFDDIGIFGINSFAVTNGKPMRCKDVHCDKCDFGGPCGRCGEERLIWLTSPYKKPAYKLTKFENDLFQSYVEGNVRKCKFKDICSLNKMKEKGYFKGVDEDATIEDILANCEVI